MPYRLCRNSQTLLSSTSHLLRSFGMTALLAFAAAAIGLTAGADVAIASDPRADSSRKTLQYTAGSDTLDLAGLEQSFRHLASTVTPSVVAITASPDPAPPAASFRSKELTVRAIDSLLKGGPRVVGTGFCIDADGYILTNEHVVASARQLFVTTDAGRTYAAIVVGSDPRSDLAVLKIPAQLPAVEIAEPQSLQRGQWMVAVGNPVGLAGQGEMCMSVGIISALGRDLPKLSEREGRLYSNLIQTTAEVNPGNSGGPLFDLQGRVAGVVTAVVLPHKTTNGIGFAMPLNREMRQKIERLKRGQPIVHGYLGVAVSDRPGGGVTVMKIGSSTPAEGVLNKGDVIARVDGRKVTNEAEFIRAVSSAPVDRPVAIVVERSGREVPLSMQLDSRQHKMAGVDRSSQRMFWRGLTLGLPEGPVSEGVQILEIDPRSPLVDQGVQIGSIIKQIAGQPVSDLLTLQSVIDATPAELCQLDIAPSPSGARTAYASGKD